MNKFIENLENKVMSYIYLYNLALSKSLDRSEYNYPPKDVVIDTLRTKLKELFREISEAEDKCFEVEDMVDNRYISRDIIEAAKQDGDKLANLRWEITNIIGYEEGR